MEGGIPGKFTEVCACFLQFLTQGRLCFPWYWLTDVNITLSSCSQCGNGTDMILPGNKRERQEQKVKHSCNPPSYSSFLLLSSPGCTPFPFAQVYSPVWDCCYSTRSFSEFAFVMFIIVIIISISDSCFLCFLQDWFWGREPATYLCLPCWYPWAFFF